MDKIYPNRPASFFRAPTLGILLIILNYPMLMAQTPDTTKIQWSGYCETYFSTHLENHRHFNSPSYIVSYDHTTGFSLNIGMIKAAVSNKKMHGNFGLMAGQYAIRNAISTEGYLGIIYEANAGFAVNKSGRTWLDAGIFSSHIGYETALGKENFNLTRTLHSDNSPFYESGVKLSTTSKKQKWNAAFLLLNGWQNMARYNNTNPISVGLQVQYIPNSKILINYSNYLGDPIDNIKSEKRFYNNLYSIFTLSKKIKGIIGIDFSAQKDSASEPIAKMVSPAILLQYECNNKWNIATRMEYYRDDKSKLIHVNEIQSSAKSELFSATLNADYKANNNILWRTEFRYFNELNYQLNLHPARYTLFTSSLCFWF